MATMSNIGVTDIETLKKLKNGKTRARSLVYRTRDAVILHFELDDTPDIALEAKRKREAVKARTADEIAKAAVEKLKSAPACSSTALVAKRSIATDCDDDISMSSANTDTVMASALTGCRVQNDDDDDEDPEEGRALKRRDLRTLISVFPGLQEGKPIIVQMVKSEAANTARFMVCDYSAQAPSLSDPDADAWQMVSCFVKKAEPVDIKITL